MSLGQVGQDIGHHILAPDPQRAQGVHGLSDTFKSWHRSKPAATDSFWQRRKAGRWGIRINGSALPDRLIVGFRQVARGQRRLFERFIIDHSIIHS